MTRRTQTHPDVADPRTGAPFFSTWRVGTPERQARAVEAVTHVWERRSWPSAGLLGYHLYTGHDGSTLLHHSQWGTEQAYEAFVRTHRQERNDEIDTAVPGIERLWLGRYRRHRSRERATGDVRVPGLIVTVRIDFEPSATEHRADWADLVLDAVADDPVGHRGLISAHFHLSTDGSHVLNYAEWESVQAYDEAVAAPEKEPWERVRTYPGVRGFTGSRFTHAAGLVPD
ncbi:antibiotic biosynthesis monooxygenase [Streptomyces aurantiogriseus]|uniref:Antibiotic biosynthesis monooxygenase n=1 Tax=Streptomyces aurantiogriseus TaxID=66870 RepID=A0A918KYP7_9ACTN|nr:antibiotic biosynthesis monooxygenase [Streptomyces aurantiogriseus]GGR50502.1 antibiotic biosynthesis monooxygenase [Streptomyces aurantiogriseus]